MTWQNFCLLGSDLRSFLISRKIFQLSNVTSDGTLHFVHWTLDLISHTLSLFFLCKMHNVGTHVLCGQEFLPSGNLFDNGYLKFENIFSNHIVILLYHRQHHVGGLFPVLFAYPSKYYMLSSWGEGNVFFLLLYNIANNDLSLEKVRHARGVSFYRIFWESKKTIKES